MLRATFYTIFGSSVTIAGAWAIGALLLRPIRLALSEWERYVIAFLLGSAGLSAAVFALASVGLVRKAVFLVFAAVIIAVAMRFTSLCRPAVNWPLAAAFAIVTVVYAVRMAPSQGLPDIMMYRLAGISRVRGFQGVFPAGLNEVFESLFLFPFVISHYSAAIAVNVALVIAQASLVFCTWRRIGYPVAGFTAATLTYLASAAQPDSMQFTYLGPSVVLFALLYLFWIWDECGVLTLAALTLAVFEIGGLNRIPFASLALAFSVTTLPNFLAVAWRFIVRTAVRVWSLPVAAALATARAIRYAWIVTCKLARAIRYAWIVTCKLARAVWQSPPIRALARVPWYAWVILAILSPWIAAYTARSATVRGYFWVERHWLNDAQQAVMGDPVPTLCRIGLLGPARIQVEPGMSFRLDPRDLVAVSILRGGVWQPDVWQSIEPALSEGAVFLDVGAHIGYFSMKAAPKLGPTGHVIAFEPNPETLKLLRENVAVNNARNVIVEPIACTDREEMLTLYAAPIVNTGSSSLARKNADIAENDPPRPYQVRGRPIDDVIAELGLTRVDAIKIDVEGAEVYVLRGAIKTLKRFHPRVVVEEVAEQLAAMQTTREDLAAVMHQAGYTRHKPAGTTDWEWTAP